MQKPVKCDNGVFTKKTKHLNGLNLVEYRYNGMVLHGEVIKIDNVEHWDDYVHVVFVDCDIQSVKVVGGHYVSVFVEGEIRGSLRVSGGASFCKTLLPAYCDCRFCDRSYNDEQEYV